MYNCKFYSKCQWPSKNIISHRTHNHHTPKQCSICPTRAIYNTRPYRRVHRATVLLFCQQTKSKLRITCIYLLCAYLFNHHKNRKKRCTKVRLYGFGYVRREILSSWETLHCVSFDGNSKVCAMCLQNI